MEFTLAPLEGVSGYIFRNAQAACFGPADRYVTPFLSPTQSGVFSHRELREVIPAHNEGLNVVPQLIVNSADNFLWAARELQELGYDEVNLNLGCPSGTVVSKGKGAGFLAYPDRLEAFFDRVFGELDLKISVKTRIGVTSPEEFPALLELFSRYPICELTVHPRVRADFYRGVPHREAFARAVERCPFPLCYNGDIFSPADLAALSARFPTVDRVMVGRGAIAHPALIRELKGGPAPTKEELRAFHDRLYEGYCAILSGDRVILARLKELWTYLIFSFTNWETYRKPLRKVTRLSEYNEIVSALFRNEDAVGAGQFHPSLL